MYVEAVVVMRKKVPDLVRNKGILHAPWRLREQDHWAGLHTH